MANASGEEPIHRPSAAHHNESGSVLQRRLQSSLKRIAAAFSLNACGVFVPPAGNPPLASLYTAQGVVRFPGVAAPILEGVSLPSDSRRFLPLGDPLHPQAWFFCTADAPVAEKSLQRRVRTSITPFLNKLYDTAPSSRIDIPAELLCGETIIWEDGFLLRESRTIYRFCRGLQKTPRLNELIHFTLSAITSPGGGNFPAALLLMLNERSGAMQGVLGVTRSSSQLVLPLTAGADVWLSPRITVECQRSQRNTPFGRMAAHLRLTLEEAHPLNRALHERRMLRIDAAEGDGLAALLAEEVGEGDYVCVPLYGRERPFGVLVVGEGGEMLTEKGRDFLDLFARQAETAIENALLLRRLEGTSAELHETQERVQQDEKLAMLGELVASIAHDIKTPLVTVGGFARRLERLTEQSEAHSCASVIAREIHRLEEILGGILSFSRRQMVCYETCDPSEMVRAALELEDESLRRSGIEVVTEVERGLAQIQGDQPRLIQVLINLVVNARHAMPDGGVLTIRVRRGILRGDPAVAIEVEDCGTGISDEIIGNIFKPFFTTKAVGTGLGLAISARIIEQHHGEIRAINHPGGGAVFRFVLPASIEAR